MRLTRGGLSGLAFKQSGAGTVAADGEHRTTSGGRISSLHEQQYGADREGENRQ